MFDDFEGFENDDTEYNKKVIIEGLTFERTCSACPEQYDVYNKEGEQVGYVRLRWGTLRCDVPDYGQNTIYRVSFNDPYLGLFPDDKARTTHLQIIAKLINENV